jgi:hypothetical protein
MALMVPPFSGGVASFEDHNHACVVVPDPVLQRAKLHLELSQLLFVFLALHRLFDGPHRSSSVMRYGSPGNHVRLGASQRFDQTPIRGKGHHRPTRVSRVPRRRSLQGGCLPTSGAAADEPVIGSRLRLLFVRTTWTSDAVVRLKAAQLPHMDLGPKVVAARVPR